MKLKKGDKVIGIAGKNTGKQGEILKVLPRDGKVVVSGMSEVKKHTKASRTSQGGVVIKNAPFNISNVAYFDQKANKASRIGFKILEDGSKKRFSKASGELIG